MEDIRFYDFEGTLIAIVHDVVTVNWRICYNDIGTFEAHFSPHAPFASDLLAHPWLVAVQGNLQAIITGRELGKELALYGKTPNWLLTKRGILPFVTGDVSSGDGVSVPQLAQWIFEKAFDQQDPVVWVGATGPFSQQTISFWRNTANPAFEVMRDCLERDSGGHNMVFDPKQGLWKMGIYKGHELDLLLSEDNRNAHDTVYTEDCLELAQEGWYGKELNSRGDYDPIGHVPPIKNNIPENFGKYYQMKQTGSRFGLSMPQGHYLLCDTPEGSWRVLNPQEMEGLDCIWIKQQGPETTSGIYRWECILSAQTQSSALTELTEKKQLREITLVTHDILYGQDYQLGDVVRVQKSSGGIKFVQQKRVSAVNIWYEQGNSGQQPEFREM